MTPKEQKFCAAYSANPSARDSAREAGYSAAYINSKAYKILERPHIIAEIKRLRGVINERAEKTATDVVNEFSKIAFIDRVSFLKEDDLRPGEFMYKSPEELTQEQRDIVEDTKIYNVEIVLFEDKKPKPVWRQQYTYVLSDKAKALEQMGRHYGIFDDKLKLLGSQANPFINATNAQLEELKGAFIKTMTDPKLIENVEFKEVKPNGN